MNELKQKLKLNNGVVLPNRVVMAPMTTKGASWDGIIDQNDVQYFGRRAGAAGLLITGATAVSELGEKFPYQQSIYADRFILGLTAEAKAMKSRGNKAIVQLYHAGVNAQVSFEKLHKVVGPSAVALHQVAGAITELSEADVWQVVDQFGAATKRALAAGFDGVEIHGAFGHLLQQFFSPYSNQRSDYWGGTLEKRMRFPLAVVKRVQEVVQAADKSDFIIGYRITSTEKHTDGIGYDIAETLQLIDQLAATRLDYVHVTEPDFDQQIKEQINGRTALITIAHTTSVASAAAALANTDLVAMARELIAEPDYATKLTAAQPIATAITSAQQALNLALPPRMLGWLIGPNGDGLVPQGKQYLSAIAK
jgi:2,4-dienoyl-CoA reductase-like NADH-dependent reductase (Old Yellow Enzyme family)